MPISVSDSRELQAAVLAVRTANRDLRRMIAQGTRTLSPEWARELDSAASRTADRAVFLPLAKVKAGNPPEFHAGTSTRVIGGKRGKGGGRPADLAGAYEFGTRIPNAPKTYRRRSKTGDSHSVTRRTRRQLPRANPRGRVVHPTAAIMLPRFTALWLQTIVRAYGRAAEGERA